MRRQHAFLLVALACAAPSHGQQLTLLAGGMRSDAPRDTSFGLRVDYLHPLDEHFGASVSYGNEGHIPGHHRDHHALQIWARTSDLAPGLHLAAGAGPIHYFDTEVAEGTHGFANAHGGGAIYSAAASWRPGGGRWQYQLRVDRVATSSSIDTTMVLVGAGYRLDPDAAFPRGGSGGEPWRPGRREATAYLGQTIVNSFESQAAGAKALEYRHALGPVARVSAAFLDEGDARLVRREGLVVEGWLEPRFSRGRFTLGAGGGGYYAVDAHHAAGRRLMGVVSATASWNAGRHWTARFTWHRVVSDYDRDSDILLLGVGYRF